MKQTSTLSLSRKDKEKRRLKAIDLLKKGRTQYFIANKLGVSYEAVSQWVKAYKKKGKKGLLSKGKSGPKGRLSQAKKQKIRQAILKGPKAMGYPTDLWTLERLAALIKKIAKVEYHPGHVWKIIIGLGFTCQKPQTKAKERQEKVIKEWRKKTFPRFKKMGSKT